MSNKNRNSGNLGRFTGSMLFKLADIAKDYLKNSGGEVNIEDRDLTQKFLDTIDLLFDALEDVIDTLETTNKKLDRNYKMMKSLDLLKYLQNRPK